MVAATNWLNTSCTRPVSFVFNTGAELILLLEDALEPGWSGSIQINKKLWLRDATNLKIEVVVTIILLVRIREARLRFVLEIVKNLAVHVLFGAFFIDNFLMWFFCADREKVLESSQPIRILRVQQASKDSRGNKRTSDVTSRNTLGVETDKNAYVVCVAIATKLPQISKNRCLNQ